MQIVCVVGREEQGSETGKGCKPTQLLKGMLLQGATEAPSGNGSGAGITPGKTLWNVPLSCITQEIIKLGIPHWLRAIPMDLTSQNF